MAGPTTFTQDNRKEVFTFFSTILCNYKDPIYYEHIRGHVSKASPIVRKYVATKCKGETLLEYFKVRKNYFVVEGYDVKLRRRKRVQSDCTAVGTDVLLRRRRRVQSECVADLACGWKKERTDKENTKQSYSISAPDEKREHEDYVNKYFSDLVARHGKIIPSSLEYDNLPKKVKRHLDLYHKKKVANYFAYFPNKFSFDKEGNVSFKIPASCDSWVSSESSDVDAKASLNPADVNSLPIADTTKGADSPIDHEVSFKCNIIEALMFFTDILIKKKTSLTVDQLGGYLSQAPKELRTFLKFNFHMLKHFFEEYSVIFFLNSFGEVALSTNKAICKCIIKQMKRIVSKTLNGTYSVEEMNEKFYFILHNETLVEMESSKHSYSSELAEPFNAATIDIVEELPNLNMTPVSSMIASKSDFIEVLNEKKVAEENTIVTHLESEKVVETLKFSEDTTEMTDFESNGVDKNYEISETDTSAKSNIENDSNMKNNQNPSMESEINEHLNNKPDVVLPNRKLLEFFLTFELFCLEMAEKDLEFTIHNELNAIQYFIEVLNESLSKEWSLSSLHGTVGKASADVSSFIKKKYKGDKFVSFFEHQTEFVVDGQCVKLSSSYQKTFSKRLTALSVSAHQYSKWNLLKLYESICFKDVSDEVGALFHDICRFLENKNKTKLSRLEGIVTNFPKCLEWIKALDGTTLAKKIGSFFGGFSIFQVFDEEYIYFSHKGCCDTIINFFKRKIDFLSLFHLWDSNFIKDKSHIDLFDLSKESCYLLKEAIKNEIPVRYCEVVKILPTPILLEIYNIGIGTKIIIDTVLKTEEFFLQNGKIDFKSEKNVSYCLENGSNSSLGSNEELGTPIQESTERKDVLKISTGSNTTSQQTDETLSVHCNNCNNTYSFKDLHTEFLDSFTSSEAFPPSTPVTLYSDSNICDKNLLELPDSELSKCNSQTLDSKGKIEIDSMNNDKQSLSQNSIVNKIDSIVSEDDGTQIFYSSECYDSVNVLEGVDMPVSEQTGICNGEEDYDSLVEEIDSVANAFETSLSSLEDELDYTIEENVKTLNDNGISAEIRWLDDTCVSSQLLDSCDKNNLLSKDLRLEQTNISTPTTIQYIDLLNEDNELPEFGENIDTNENKSIINKSELNHLLYGSLATLANDLNLYQTETKENKQNVSSVFKSNENETGFLKVKETGFKIVKHKMENITEMKHNAELLAKEVFQNGFYNIQPSKIFVACNSTIFLFKKNYLSKMYGPLICTKENIPKNLSGIVPINKEASVSSNDSDSLNNLKSAVNESLNHSLSIATEAEVTLQNVYHKKNSCPLNMSSNNCKDIIDEYPLQPKFDSINDIKDTAKLNDINGESAHGNYSLPKEVNLTNSSNSNISLGSDDSYPNPNAYLFQPILAKVVLVTVDSCIAVAKIESRKQNIYFLKCVFVCDHQYCCSDCFNDLKISDTVSCFVPPTEMSRKMWIALMVSKESSTEFEEINSFNEVLRKQNEGGCMNRNMFVNSKSVSIQTEHPCLEFGCQTDSFSTELACQTHLSGDVKLCAVTENSMSQTNVSVKSVFIQTTNETKSSECQTNFFQDRINVESQTDITGVIKESPTYSDVLCQTDSTGEMKLSINVVNTECQTISTGQVMITKYYHL